MMKSTKLDLFFGLMLIGFLAIGCVKSNTLPRTPSPEAPLILSPSEALPTYTLRPTPVPSPTLTSTPFHILTPTPSDTPIVIPTLSVEDARLRLLDLLAENGDCRLPCLWGIKPGESSYQEAWTRLAPLSSISSLTGFETGLGTIEPSYAIEDGLKIDIFVAFLAKDNVVTRISFEGRALKELSGERGVESVFDSALFGEQLAQYMLPQILSEYGRPSSVLLSTLAEFPSSRYGQGHFQILLLYPDQGFLVHYTTEMHVTDKNVVGCPANAHIELELYPSSLGDSFFEFLAPTNWPEAIKNNYKPLEEVTSMSLEEFYQSFRQSTGKCLETPANLWPVPEK
jgi:hypothetical protein